MSAVLTGSQSGQGAPQVGCSQRTSAIARGLLLLLDHHGCPLTVQSEITHQLHGYLDNSKDEAVWLKRMKYVLTYPMSIYLKNELPARPDVAFEFTGIAWGWMRPRLKFFSRRNTHLWYSWLQAKRSALAASDDLVHQAYEKHREMLTSVDRGVPDTIDDMFDEPTFRAVLERVRDSITETYRDNFTDLFPSNNASYEKSRKDGGQAGHLHQLVGSRLVEFKDDEGVFSKQIQLSGLRMEGLKDPAFGWGELYRMDVCPRIKDGLYRLDVIEQRFSPCSEWNESLRLRLSLMTNFDRNATAMIQAVLEPMKIRVISKGPALEYYSCKPVQRAMHDVMRKMDCFRAIGRPLSATDIEDIARKAGRTDVWFSVDYSAATDGLSWKYSGRIMRKILEDLPHDVYRRCEQVLGPHALEYPKNAVESGMMNSGQLMGSILSFPILCLANLGVYLYTTRYDQVFWSDEERLASVLINGDDMVYAAQPELWDEHVRNGKDVGLEMSVGKAYHHHTYVNINSTSYHCDLRDFKRSAYKIGYLNSGLFYGNHKVMNRDVAQAHTNAKEGVVANYNVVMDGALPGRGAQLHSRWLKENETAVQSECAAIVRKQGKFTGFTRNLFLPISCGGMGCVPPADVHFKVTLLQKQVAYSLAPRDAVSFGSPLSGKEIVNVLTWKRLPSDAPALPEEASVPTFNAGKEKLARNCCVLGFTAVRKCIAAFETPIAWSFNPL